MTVYPNRTTEPDDEVTESRTGGVGTCTRIQQPDVRINPNLMKIKMDVDYNPIVEPKRELIEMRDEIQSQDTLSQVKRGENSKL